MEERELTQLLQRLGDRVTPGPAPVGRILAEGRAGRRRRSGRVRLFVVAAAAAAVVGGGSVAAVVLDLPSGGDSESADSAAGGEAATSGTDEAGRGGSDAGAADGGASAADATDAFVVAPDVARPGGQVELASRDEERAALGSVWRLERLTPDGWTEEYTLLTGGGEPTWGPPGERAGEDAPAPSAGPVAVVVPPAAAAGEYRVCRSDGTEDLCGRLTVRR